MRTDEAFSPWGSAVLNRECVELADLLDVEPGAGLEPSEANRARSGDDPAWTGKVAGLITGLAQVRDDIGPGRPGDSSVTEIAQGVLAATGGAPAGLRFAQQLLEETTRLAKIYPRVLNGSA